MAIGCLSLILQIRLTLTPPLGHVSLSQSAPWPQATSAWMTQVMETLVEELAGQMHPLDHPRDCS